MKKIVFVLILAMLFSTVFLGCSEPVSDSENSASSSPSEEPTPSPTPSSTSSPTPSPTPSEEISIDPASKIVEDVNLKFFSAQITIEHALDKDTSLTQANGQMELKQTDGIANEYSVFLPVGTASIYYHTNDAKEVLASALIVDDFYADEYRGKTAVASMSLAFVPLVDDESLTDRIKKIDSLNPSSQNFIVVGDILGDSAMISPFEFDGFTVYSVMRNGLSEEENEVIFQWVQDVTQRAIDAKNES